MKQQLPLLFSLLMTAAITTFGQPGTLDHSFGGNGLVRTPLDFGAGGEGAAVQSDGKIVVAGWYYPNDYMTNFLVARYNINGTLDNTFAGGDGEQGISFGNQSEGIKVAIQSDGKIVAVGSIRDNGIHALVVVRLNTNGTMDNSFGTGGKVQVTTLGWSEGSGLAIQSDGKILVTGYSDPQNQGLPAIARLLSNGTTDNTFGVQGKILLPLTDPQSGINYTDIAMQADGKIVLCGTVFHYISGVKEILTWRVNANGTTDITYGTNGTVFETVGSYSNSGAHAVKIQSDGKIVVGGYYQTGASDSNFLVIRYNANGTHDNTFAGNGRAGVSFSHSAEGTGIALQSGGNVIIGGYVRSSQDEDFAMARLLTNGTLDTHFGSDNTGKVTTGFGYDDVEHGITLQPTGEIVAVGRSGGDIGLARYLVTIAIPPPPPPAVVQTAVSKMVSLQPALYPNPANGSVQLTGLDPQSITQYSITNAVGKIQVNSTIAFSSTAQINTAQLSPGVYFIQLKTNNNTTTLRLVKQ
jgi:uncharacterized delta-60 repeat protein